MPHLLDAASIIITPTAYEQNSLLAVKPDTGTGDMNYTRNGQATRINSSGLIEIVESDVPRIDYTSGTGVILAEPSSTNLVTNSDPSNGSQITGAFGITIQSFAWPTGLLENSIVFPSGSSVSTNRHGVMPTGVDIAVSCFVIMDDLSEPKVGGTSQTGGVKNDFSLRANNLNVASSSVEVVNLGNSVYRVSGLVESSRNNSGNINSGVLKNSNYSGKGFKVSGMQIEPKSFVTSYIPTVEGTATRAADIFNNSGDSSLINSTEGVLYAEMAALSDEGVQRSISLSSGAIQNTVEIIYNSVSNQVSFRLRANNSNITVQNKIVSDTTEFIKVALKYKSGDIKAFINGVKEIEITDSFTFSSPLSELAFDRGGTQSFFSGKLKSVVVFPESLTDEELICLTT